jgi:hypothetical protein
MWVKSGLSFVACCATRDAALNITVCWGEGKGATPRSKSSLITAGQTETEQAGTPFA